MNLSSQLSRRKFVGAAAAGAAGVLLSSCNEPAAPPVNTLESATLKTRRTAPTQTITPGMHALGLDATRDGFIYVPPSYSASVSAPLLVLLHGAGRSSADWRTAAPLIADEKGIVILAPDSAGQTWDRIAGNFGPDVAFIDAALAVVFRKVNINPAIMALGGFSDGASYALSLGVPNGDLFPRIIAFSPGFMAAPGARGTPRIFVSHGLHDPILPIDTTSRRIVPALREFGYEVQYREFDGEHTVPLAIAQEAVAWMIPPSA